MNHGKVSRDIALGLKELKKRIDKSNIPSSKLDETLNLATWNIRDFGKSRRQKKSLHYIAEVLGQFDLVAVQEVRDNLRDLAEVLKILGPYWKVLYSDYIADAGGNRERMAYVYDKRAVTFTGLAAEPNAPRKKNDDGEYVPAFSWWRSPYIASFSAGSFDFILISAHIRWGKKASERIEPLELLADWIDKRRNEKNVSDQDIILMGDFNIPKVDDALFKAVTKNGLTIPKKIRGLDHGSNLDKSKRYDQILHYPVYNDRLIQEAGVLDFYAGNVSKLYPGVEMTKRKFTHQISDHLPLWVQLNTDNEHHKLNQIINPERAGRR
jgi:endonuclease/exonuclease/phosphatase family metal-dependent hydrolase